MSTQTHADTPRPARLHLSQAPGFDPAALTIAAADFIAARRAGITTLQARNSDTDDFKTVAVWNLFDMLADAFALGQLVAANQIAGHHMLSPGVHTPAAGVTQ